MKCKTCKDLELERKVEIRSVVADDGFFYGYDLEIVYCPTCGKMVKYKKGIGATK